MCVCKCVQVCVNILCSLHSPTFILIPIQVHMENPKAAIAHLKKAFNMAEEGMKLCMNRLQSTGTCTFVP